jgi:hypothetical protein
MLRNLTAYGSNGSILDDAWAVSVRKPLLKDKATNTPKGIIMYTYISSPGLSLLSFIDSVPVFFNLIHLWQSLAKYKTEYWSLGLNIYSDLLV